MITGAVIFFIGIIIGYSVRLWTSPLPKGIQGTLKSFIRKEAKIVDLSPDIDLGNDENK